MHSADDLARFAASLNNRPREDARIHETIREARRAPCDDWLSPPGYADLSDESRLSSACVSVVSRILPVPAKLVRFGLALGRR